MERVAFNLRYVHEHTCSKATTVILYMIKGECSLLLNFKWNLASRTFALAIYRVSMKVVVGLAKFIGCRKGVALDGNGGKK